MTCVWDPKRHSVTQIRILHKVVIRIGQLKSLFNSARLRIRLYGLIKEWHWIMVALWLTRKTV